LHKKPPNDFPRMVENCMEAETGRKGHCNTGRLQSGVDIQWTERNPKRNESLDISYQTSPSLEADVVDSKQKEKWMP